MTMPPSRDLLRGIKIVMLENAEGSIINVLQYLRRLGVIIIVEGTVEGAQQRLREVAFDVIISAHNLGMQRGSQLMIWLLHNPQEVIKMPLRVSYSGSDPDTLYLGIPAELRGQIYDAMVPKGTPPRQLAETIRALIGAPDQPADG